MAPLATMLLGVTRARRAGVAPARAPPSRSAAAAVVVLTISYGRPPWIALIIAVSWSLYGLLKRQIAARPGREPRRRDVPARRPGRWCSSLVMAGRGGSIPATATGRRLGARRRSPASSRPSRCCCSPYAAQRVPFTLLGALQYLVPTINLVLGWLVYDEDDAGRAAVRLRPRVGRAGAVTVDQVGTPSQRAAPRRRPPRGSVADGRQLAFATSCRTAAASPRARPVLAARRRRAGRVRWPAVDRGLRRPGECRSSRATWPATRSSTGSRSTAAQCDEPASTKAGTEFACTAMGSDGQQRTLHGQDRRTATRCR